MIDDARTAAVIVIATIVDIFELFTTITNLWFITNHQWGIFIEEPECLPNVCKYTLVGTFGSAGSIVPGWYATLISSR